MPKDPAAGAVFGDFELAPGILQTLTELGYEQPTPIQSRTIPSLLAGRDVLGQAQTGTGKTAAFALPLLSRIDPARRAPQVLVLTPTRELAMQVAEAFKRYAARLQGVQVLAVYGGQNFTGQRNALVRGVHVIVGTPGRVMDHMERGTLRLDGLAALVLDEADEMLRMGFIDDVEHILRATPEKRQLALFSATMPREVQRIAERHLVDADEVRLEGRTAPATAVRQRVWMVTGTHKLDALTRILETETFDALIVFVRTKIATVELAGRLCERGFDAAAINGDLAQDQRERLIENLRSGSLDILVATDVAARGLDVERVSHVVNFDIPYDPEAYVHRIGRTGRAGRSGDAILFVAPRERSMLQAIERATRQTIEPMKLPSHDDIRAARVSRFFKALSETLAQADLSELTDLVTQYQQEHQVDPLRLAAALAHQSRAGAALLRQARKPAEPEIQRAGRATETRVKAHSPKRPGRDKRKGSEAAPKAQRSTSPSTPATDMERFRLEVGLDHGAGPSNIVGALINEAGLDRQYIGRVNMESDHSTVELPPGMPKEIFKHLQTVWVAGRRLQISRLDAGKVSNQPTREVRRRPARQAVK